MWYTGRVGGSFRVAIPSLTGGVIDDQHHSAEITGLGVGKSRKTGSDLHPAAEKMVKGNGSFAAGIAGDSANGLFLR